MSLFSRFLLLALLFSANIVYGQIYEYQSGSGSLRVEVLGSNPCFNGATLIGGYIEFRVLSTVDGQPAELNTIIKQGGGGPNFFTGATIPVGSSFIFYANNTGVPGGSSFTPNLPIGRYDFYIEDNAGTEFINSFAANPIELVQFADIVINQDLLQNNSDCSAPLDGQVVASVSGGSLALVGGAPPQAEQTSPESSFTYTWSADNGLPQLTPPLVGTWSGTTPLDLAALLGVPGLPGGTYTLVVEDDYSRCSETRQFTITDPTPAIQNVLAPFTQSVCAGSNITIQLDNSEVGVTYQIHRNGSATPLFSFPGGTAPLVMTFPSTGFNSGDFIVVRATDGFCSPATMNNQVSLTVNPLPTASISGTTTICAGGTATLTFTLPAVGTYNVVYTDGTTNFNANGISNGATVNVTPTANTTYTIVSVTNVATLCSVTAPHANITGSAVVTVNPLPTASISGTTTVCAGGTATLTFTLPSGTYNVVYTNGTTNFNANGITNGATVNVTPSANTTYTIVSVSNTASTCIVTAPHANITGSAVVTVNPLPTASISGTTTICAGGSATLTFTLSAGTYNVVYTNGTTNFNANGISNGATVSVSPTVNTTYTIVSITNTTIASCAVTAPSPNITGSAIISINPLPTASISGTSAICSGGNATLTFTLPPGTYNVVYTDGTTNFNANGIANGATVSVSPTTNTTYTIVSVTNTATTCSVTAPSPNITGSAVISVNTLPTASISGTATICTGASTLLTFTLPAGTYNVVYTNGTTNFNANGITNGATVSVTPSANTTYTIVSVTNVATSCSVTAPSPNITGSAVITLTPLPTASISGTTTICLGGSATLTFTLPAGTYNVVYTNGTTNFTANGISNGATVNVSPTTNTTYTIVSVTNTATTCSVTAPNPNITGSAIITVSPLPTASISGTTAICPGGNATLTFTLPPGTYNVVYTNGTTNFNANGISNGATVSVSPAANTTYTIVSVTNTATTCSVTAPSPNITGSAVITINSLPTASISGTATICAGASTPLTFTLPSGTYNVVYTNGTTNFNANGISSGATVNVTPTANTTYTIVSVTNTATTCSVSAPSPNITGSAVITLTPLPTASISGTTTICSGGSATLTFALPAGTYNVVYTNGTTNFNANGISNGATVNVSPSANTTYTIVSVTNTATTCSVTAPSPNITGSAIITVSPLPTASISGTTTICAGGTAVLTFTLSPGTYNVVYTDGTTNFNANGITSGATRNVTPTANTTYTIVSVSNTTSTCSVTAPSPNITGSAVITVNPLPTASISGTTSICAGGSATLTFTLSAGTYNVVYTNGTTNFNANGISSGATVNVSPAANTTYTIVSVTNTTVASCTVTAPSPNITGSAVITVNTAPTASISGTSTICTGGSATLTFTLPAGTYNVVYTNGTTNFNANGITNGATVNVTPSATTTYTIVSVTNTATTCVVTAPNPGITGAAVITVNPLPTASISGTATICSGASTPLTFTLPAGTYNVVYTNGTTNFNANGISNGATVNVTPTVNTTYTIISVTNTVLASCTVTAPSPNITGSAVITIDLPTASIAGSTAICSGGNASLTFTLSPGTYDVVYTDGTTNFNANGISSGATANVSPTVNTTYTIVSVTNTTNSCSVTAPHPNITGSAIITITAPPVLAAGQVKTICDGDNVGYEILLNPLNTPAGTVFNWPDPDGSGPATAGVNVAMGTAGTIHIDDVLTNSTGAPITVSYNVTPSITGCSGTAVPVDITVLPSPNMGGIIIEPSCFNSGIVRLNFGSVVGLPDLYSVDFDDPIFVDVTDAPLTTTPLLIPLVTVSAVPAPIGMYTATLFVKNNTSGCSSAGIPITFNVIARPVPAINGPDDVCQNSVTNVYSTAPGKSNYAWTVSAGGTITAGGGLTDNSVTVTWTGLGTQTVSVNYTEITCAATAPTDFSVTVNPVPVLAANQSKTICSGDNVAYEILMNPANLPAGTRFNWPDPDGAGGPATAGVDVAMGPAGTIHINDVLTNITGAAVTTTYVITPSVGGCDGAPVNVDITVNPTPVLAVGQAKSICTGQNVAYEIRLDPANVPAGTLFNWPDPDGAGGPATAGVNVPAGPAGTLHINDILTNTTGAPIIVTYEVTPSLGTCVGAEEDVVITVNPIPVLVTPQVTTVCSGDNVDYEILLNPANLPSGTTFSWPDPDGAGPATAGVNVPMGTAGTVHITDALVNVTGSPITLTYVITPSNGSCTGVSRNVLVTVDPAPVLATNQNKTICTGENVAYEILLNPANLPAGTIFSWPDPDAGGPATAGVNVPMGLPGTTHINDVLTATGTPTVVTYRVTATSPNGCDGVSQDIVVTVNPIPVVAAGQTKTICSGASVGLEIQMNPANTPAGTTFSWPDPDGAGPATAGTSVAIGVPGTLHINDILTNSTAAPITVTYVVTPTVGTCVGTPEDIDIIVDPFPAPVLVSPQAKAICSGDNVAYEILLNPANQPPGTLLNWPDPDGTGPATAGVNVPADPAGTTHINDVLTNTGSTPLVVTYVVTPESASGCSGTPRNVVITVNPSPVIAAGQTKTICSGANVGLEILLNPVNTPTGTTFSWPDPDGAGPATAGNNVAMGIPGTIHIDDALTNSTAAPITVTYVVTPTLGGCAGPAEDIDIVVDPFPAPVMVTGQAKTICSGDNVAYEILLNPANTPAGTLFNWPDPDGTGPATDGVNVSADPAGTTHINDVLINTGSTPLAVTYVVTPVSASGCTGTPRNVVITVNPSPVIAAGQAKTICSGANVGLEILLDPVNTPTGTTFSWPDPDGTGPATAGTNVAMGLPGTIHINDILTNSTAAPITVTYVVTPTLGGCSGPAEDIDITVSPFPAPVLAAGQTKTICSGESVAYEILLNPANTPAGTTFSWNDPDGTGPATSRTNVAADPAGITHINDILINTSSSPITVTYVVTPNSASGCSGSPQNVTITVNPAPALAAAQGVVICSGNAVGYHIQLTPLDQPAGTTFSWPDPDGAGPATAGTNVALGGPSTIHINDILTNTSGAPITVTYAVTPSLGSCTGTTQNITVTVRDASSPLCNGGGPGPSDCANFSAIIPTIVTQPSCSDRDAGEVSFNIARANGTPSTFRVVWTYNGTNQTKFTSGTVSFDDLNSGLYRYTITDEGNGRTCGPVDFFLDLKTQVEIQQKQVISNVTCYDGTDGNVKLTVDGTTTGEYWYKYVRDGQESIAQTFTPGAPLPGGLPADDDFIIIKVDESFAFSCPDTVMVRINHMYPKIDFTVASTEVTSCNGTDGGIQVSAIAGGNTTTSALQIRLKKEVPLSTDPTGYITLDDFETITGAVKNYTDLAQGNYVVDVKDGSDCIQSKPIAVQAPGQVPLAVVDIVPTDASCANEGASGSIRVTINDPGIYQVAVSQDQVNVPADDQFIPYNSPSLPNVTFSNLVRGRYFLYIKSNTTECPTRSELIEIGGVYAVGDFEILSNCENVNLTLNNITGEDSSPFVIRVFDNDDKFFKIDSLTASSIPDSKSVSFVYSPPLTHKFLTEEGTYRFVMIQKQTTGAGTCTLVSDTVVYDVREHVGIVLGQVKPSFPDPKRTGSIEIENIIGGQRFVSGTNELYYEIALSTADDDIVVFDWTQIKLNAQNKFAMVFDYLSPGVYRIEVRDASGCVKTQDVEISLDPSVYVPNIFTPNEDNVNDQFEVLNLPLGGKHKLIISDRWGKQVFKSDDYRTETFWDAAGVTDGIYFYRLQVEAGETFTGWVEVLRGNKP